ncbi:MAG TPA: hypothetical protein VFG54_12805, partial [Prolixibacteraceae bacterium]|nr:hypothetical protein [Prolixibacteraceae bacterium]
MKTKNTSYKKILFGMAVALSALHSPVWAQDADQLLLKDYRPVSLYKVPVTVVEKAAYPAIDIHSHDYARTAEEVAQ